jgi:2-polyprenyl-6-methoxyphenol hydroxylase-like FAD-dependent oxidoreductase
MVRGDVGALTSLSVLISGIGVAGPTLAYWLDKLGHRPTLVEQAPRLRGGGYVVDFWGVGYDVAERMGLLPALRRNGYEVQELRFIDGRGRRVGGFGVDVFRRLTGGRYLSIARSDLAATIYGAIDGRCEAMFGDRIIAIEPGDGGVGVEFARAPARRFDCVVGADGQHSAVRALTFGSEDMFEHHLGYTVAAFEARGYRPRDEDVYVSYGRPGRQVARFALHDDRTLFLFVFATPPGATGASDDKTHKAILHAAFGGAGWECPHILAALDRCDDVYFDRVSQIRMAGWARGRVGLVGDAAFCPSLLAGQGSALAMAAAYVLAGELAENGVEKGFGRYEQRLREFIAGKQDAAQRFAGSFAPATRLGLFVRDQVTRLFRIPFVADAVLGRGVLDRFELPEYLAL